MDRPAETCENCFQTGQNQKYGFSVLQYIII